MKKILLHGPFIPHHIDNKMKSEGSLEESRDNFLKKRFKNLDFLLETRYKWINHFLKNKKIVVEVGSGSGFSRLYLDKKIILTDANDNSWIDKFIDATSMDFKDNSIDVIIASHTIHHFYSPYKFFKECDRVLKKNGLIIINEINTSLLMRVLLKIMKHEGWSYNVDVFSPSEVVNQKDDPWSANCAVPEMLFSDEARFIKTFQSFRFVKNELCEFLIFPISGGVVSKTKVPELPLCILKILSFLDKLFIKIFPSIFALGRRVVLKKI